MSIEKLSETLRELNLSEKESKIYLNLLRLGQTNVTRLAHDSKINRVTTYHILDSLLNKGLVTSTNRDKITHFQAVNPKRLIGILKEKEEKINSILPQLESLKKSAGKKPVVELYEGPKGISTLLDQTLNTKKDILTYGNYSIAKEVAKYQSLNFRKKRVNKKIKLRSVINTFDKEFIKLANWDKFTKVKILKTLDKITTFIQIYNDSVAILSFDKELIGIKIDNKEIADMHRFFFKLLWDNAKQLKHK